MAAGGLLWGGNAANFGAPAQIAAGYALAMGGGAQDTGACNVGAAAAIV
jgi:hypothetical protein